MSNTENIRQLEEILSSIFSAKEVFLIVNISDGESTKSEMISSPQICHCDDGPGISGADGKVIRGRDILEFLLISIFTHYYYISNGRYTFSYPVDSTASYPLTLQKP